MIQTMIIALAMIIVSGCFNKSESNVNRADERPNILLVVIDDLGFTDLGSYGGEIRTPNLDALAEQGLRFSSFYVSPNCAPTRSMLLSGMDNHLSGNGTMAEHIGSNQRGVPGYEGYLSKSVAALPEVLGAAGYRTYMAGKWHLGRTEETSPAARGFDRSYALLLGGASHFSDKMGIVSKVPRAPYREDHNLVETLPDGFYSTDFYTDRIIDYIETDRVESDKPFFAYLSYSAVHWPLQVPDSALGMYKGAYDDGYDALRRRRYAEAAKAGVVSDNVQLEEAGVHVASWQSLDAGARKYEARKMELYAAMLDLVDQNIGRLLDYLKEAGELENTLILVMSDNGAEGNRRFRIGGDDWVEKTFDHSYEAMGKSGSYVFTGPGWAQASSAPFRLWKAHTSEGGIRAPLIVTGPGVSHRGAVTNTISTVRDLMPTILDATGTEYPAERFEGRSVLPMTGKSQQLLLQGQAQSIHPDEETFGWEIFGGRAVRQGNWKLLWVAGPNGEDSWQLYDISIDPGETTDLSAAEPSKLKAMKRLWKHYQRQNNVILPEGELLFPWGDEG